MRYYTKAQLHVSAIQTGHLQVVHENLSIGYTKVYGVFIGFVGGGVGARPRLYQGKGRHGLGLLVYTVKPRFTNASDHEQFGLRTNFPNTKRLG